MAGPGTCTYLAQVGMDGGGHAMNNEQLGFGSPSAFFYFFGGCLTNDTRAVQKELKLK